MTGTCRIVVDGSTIQAKRGDSLLDAALRSGVEINHDCRAGHCGRCSVLLVSGVSDDSAVLEPGVIRACQFRITGEATFARQAPEPMLVTGGTLRSLQVLSKEVVEVAIQPDCIMPHHPGQYAKLRFEGYPPRAYSMSLPMHRSSCEGALWFHIRYVANGRVSTALGRHIAPGHRLTLSGPLGSAHFRHGHEGRLILVATSTGFAPIWSIATAALRENPARILLIIAGGRSVEALYMAPALARLSQFPNVRIIPVCSSLKRPHFPVMPGRPTDYLPPLLPSDVVYACGSAEMVEAIKSTAEKAGADCYADPFTPNGDGAAVTDPAQRHGAWLTLPTFRKSSRQRLVVPRLRPVTIAARV